MTFERLRKAELKVAPSFTSAFCSGIRVETYTQQSTGFTAASKDSMHDKERQEVSEALTLLIEVHPPHGSKTCGICKAIGMLKHATN
jgi:hypothetical protein